MISRRVTRTNRFLDGTEGQNALAAVPPDLTPPASPEAERACADKIGPLIPGFREAVVRHEGAGMRYRGMLKSVAEQMIEADRPEVAEEEQGAAYGRQCACL